LFALEKAYLHSSATRAEGNVCATQIYK